MIRLSILFTYDLITEASAEDGDAAERGFCDATGDYRLPLYPVRSVVAHKITGRWRFAGACDRWAEAVREAAQLRRAGDSSAVAVRMAPYHRTGGADLPREDIRQISDDWIRQHTGGPEVIDVTELWREAMDTDDNPPADLSASDALDLVRMAWEAGASVAGLNTREWEVVDDRGGTIDLRLHMSSDDLWKDETEDGTPATLNMSARIKAEEI